MSFLFVWEEQVGHPHTVRFGEGQIFQTTLFSIPPIRYRVHEKYTETESVLSIISVEQNVCKLALLTANVVEFQTLVQPLLAKRQLDAVFL